MTAMILYVIRNTYFGLHPGSIVIKVKETSFVIIFGFYSFSEIVPGNPLMVQWLRPHASTAGGMGLIPGQETKIPHAARCHQKKKYICLEP